MGKRRVSRAAQVALAVVSTVVLVLLGGVAVPAVAAGNDVSVSIRPIDTSVLSGENVTFELSWQCGTTTSPDCSGGVIEVPVPTGQPDGLTLSVEAFTAVTIDGVPYPVQVTGTGANRTIVWSLPPTMSGANAGTVTFTLGTQNWITPNGTTITPSGTFTTSLGQAAATSAPAIVTSEAALKVVKTRYPDLVEDPYVGNDVTYLIQTGYPQQWNAAGGYTPYSNMCQENGLWALQDVRVVDQLPPGTVFVAANRGGVYNAQDHTVSWDLGNSAGLNPDGTARCDSTTFGQALLVTVNYPESEFTDDANDHVLQTNRAEATAHPWSRPLTDLADQSEASHYLQIGADGEFTVQKGISYAQSNANSRQYWRGAETSGGDWVRGYLHSYSIEGTGNATGTWSLTDMLPCGWTSPADTSATDCATPAYRDISFGANGSMSALDVQWVTNLGRTGVCEIPQGSTVGDSVVRACAGTSAGEPIPMQAGEWITKFWLDENPVKAGTKGKLFLFGSVSDDIPLDNSQAVADGVYQSHFLTGGTAPATPVRGVTPASEHPLWVTIENCTADNTVTWNGGSMSTNGALVDSNREGRCGYTRIVRDPVNIYTEKRMYVPALVAGGASKDSQPNLVPGESLRVEVVTQRDTWYSEYDDDVQRTFTPTITEILPANLEFDPDDPAAPVYLAWEGSARPAAEIIAKLGEPRLTVSEVQIEGVTRTQLVVDFPNVPAGGGLRVIDPVTGERDKISVGFDVRVKDSTPAGTSRNYTLVQAAEAATGYLICTSPGSYADPSILIASTTWGNLSFNNAVQGPDADTGCRAQKPYTVVEGPGMGSQKQVKGVHDEAFIPSPGVGRTDKSGVADYLVPIKNTGNVDMRDVVVYDLLPRVGDTGVRPGAVARGSEFDVFMTGPVTGLPSDAIVQYSASDNPCRGELAGNGGGSLTSAPAGCVNDWTTATPSDWSTIVGIRIDFGSRVWRPADAFTASFPAVAGQGGDLTGIAWNNVALAANRNSSGLAMLPTEAPRVGLQLAPDLRWSKVDGADESLLLGGSEWLLEPVVPAGAPAPAGTWPRTIVDCVTAGGCAAGDQDPAPGQFELKGIPWGTYTLTETVAPVGYQLLASPLQVVIGPGGLDTVNWVYDVGAVKNFKPGATLTWLKVDPASTLLAGSQWQLVAVDQAGVALPGRTPVNVSDCVAASADVCTGADQDPAEGKFGITQVQEGTYHLIETQAPPGFVKRTDPISVTVTGTTTVAIGEIENTQIAVPPLPMTGGIGSFLFAIGGGTLLGVTALLLVRSLRRSRLA